jgi:hypothetical protein
MPMSLERSIDAFTIQRKSELLLEEELLVAWFHFGHTTAHSSKCLTYQCLSFFPVVASLLKFVQKERHMTLYCIGVPSACSENTLCLARN